MRKLLSLLLILVMTVGVAYAGNGNGNVWTMDDDVMLGDDVLFDITWRASKDVTPDLLHVWVPFDIVYPLTYLANTEYFDAIGNFKAGKEKDHKKMKTSFLHLTIVGYLDGGMNFVPYSDDPYPMYKAVLGIKYYWDEDWVPFHSALDTYIFDTTTSSATYMEYIPFDYDHGYDDVLDDYDDGESPNGFGMLMKLLEGFYDK